MFSESIWAFTIVCNTSHQRRPGLTLHGTHRSVAYPNRRLLRCTKSPVVRASREIPCWPRSSKPMSNSFREHYMDPAGHFHRMQYRAVVTRPWILTWNWCFPIAEIQGLRNARSWRRADLRTARSALSEKRTLLTRWWLDTISGAERAGFYPWVLPDIKFHIVLHTPSLIVCNAWFHSLMRSSDLYHASWIFFELCR